MRIFPILLIATAPIAAQAQQVVASGGAYHQNGTTAIAYTIGEPVIVTVGTSAATLTQGFHQPWADVTTVVGEHSAAQADINVYPNPVRHTLHIATGDDVHAQRYVLHDASGRIVTDGRISSTITELDMERHASGSYFLRVFGPDDSTMKAFKISVTH